MVVVWFAIMLVLFIGVAAFAVDIAYWHLVQGREQKAADAAALAGAVSFPADQAASDNAATDVINSNGYTIGAVQPVATGAPCPVGVGATNVCAGAGTRPYQYKVTVAQDVNNFFGNIFGIGTTTVRASATAEYLKPLSMGSPTNQFGNDPESTTWPLTNPPPQSYPNFWANIAGGNSVKVNGDAFAADNCGANVDGCSGTGPGTNLDYNADGYFYSVDFTGTATVDLQVFDPGFVDVGDNCNNGNNLLGASNLASVPSYPQGPTNTVDIKKRYQPVTNAGNQQDPGLPVLHW